MSENWINVPPKQGDRGGLSSLISHLSQLIALKKRVQMYDIIPEVWAWGTINLNFLHIFPCRTQGVPEKCVTLHRKHSLLRASLGARRQPSRNLHRPPIFQPRRHYPPREDDLRGRRGGKDQGQKAEEITHRSHLKAHLSFP